MRPFSIRSFFLATVISSLIIAHAHSQFVSKQQGAPNPDGSTNSIYVIHPAREPAPALKYRLTPEFLDIRPGNAAVYYGKVMAEQANFFDNRELQTRIMDLTNAPLNEVRESAAAADAVPNIVYHHLRLAALCDSCDWQIPIRYEPYYEILLPELQQTRWFARLLAVRARYQIAHGRFDDAIETLQTGYAIAAHDATGPTYIHLLVAISVKTIMDQQLETLIQQPGAPNMYWAIAALPDPILNNRLSKEAEQNSIELTFPALRDLSVDSLGSRSPEFWQDHLVELLKLELLIGFEVDENTGKSKDPAELAELVTSSGYPKARQRLIDSGVSPEVVDKLPLAQVVLIEGVREIKQYSHDMLKWSYLPYHQAEPGIISSQQKLENDAPQLILGLARSILAPTQQIAAATARSRRQSALLQLVESVRMYAAENNGRLPDGLGDIESAPVPDDPVTCGPFICIREDDQLAISGPRLPSGVLDIKIKIADRF